MKSKIINSIKSITTLVIDHCPLGKIYSKNFILETIIEFLSNLKLFMRANARMIMIYYKYKKLL